MTVHIEAKLDSTLFGDSKCVIVLIFMIFILVSSNVRRGFTNQQNES